ncbi:MAG: hypothetical protein RJB57_384 [Actinomycetota bacterium]
MGVRKTALALCLAVVATACASASGNVIVVEQQEESRNAALPNDDGKPFIGLGCCVSAMAKDSTGHIWVGGYNLAVGRVTGGLAAFGATPDNFDRVDGTVTSVVPDGLGGFYVAGYFSRVGTSPAANLAHVGADGTHDPAFVSPLGAGSPVRDIVVQGAGATRRLYALVQLDTSQWNEPGVLVRLDPVTGAEMSRVNITFLGAPATLTGGGLVATARGIVLHGNFTSERFGYHAGAVFFGTDGQVVASLSFRQGADGTRPGALVAADSVAGANRTDSVYFGGRFESAFVVGADGTFQESKQVMNIARVSWAVTGVSISAYALAVGDVRAIDASRSADAREILHVGAGSFLGFSVAGGLVAPPNSHLVRISRSDADSTIVVSAAEIKPNGYVEMVRHLSTATGETLVASGGFSSARFGAGLTDVPVSTRLAIAVSGANGWRQLPGAFFHDGEVISDAALVNDHLLLAGDFTAMGVRGGNLLRLTPDGAFNPSLRQPSQPNDAVEALAVHGGHVYVGGYFSEIGGARPTAVAGVVRYTEAGDFDPGFARPFTHPDGAPVVRDIAFGRDRMYVGGTFEYGPARSNFATFALPDFTLLPARDWESTDGDVRDISVSADGSTVAVAGRFGGMRGWASPAVVVIDEAGGRILDSFRGSSRPEGQVPASAVSFDDVTRTVYTAYEGGETSLVNQRLDGTIVSQFVDRSVGELAASAGRLYLGYWGRTLRVIDTSTNTFLADPPSFDRTTALLADDGGVWVGGTGLRMGNLPAYGPVFLSGKGQVEVTPSAPELPPAVPVGTADVAAPATPEPAPAVVEAVVDLALSPGAGRAADGEGTVFGYRIGRDGTITLDQADMDASRSRGFLVSKLKPGDRSMTVTFRRPAGLSRVTVKSHGTGKTFTCSPGKKTSCTIRGLSPWVNYRFSVTARSGGKTVSTPRSIVVKPFVKLGRGTERRLRDIVPAPKGSSAAYSETGACSLVKGKSRLRTPRTRVFCSVTVTVKRAGIPVSRTVAVKVG